MKQPETTGGIGQPHDRIDGRLKVTGEARYGADFAVPNPLYGHLVVSTIGRGRITSVDDEAARAEFDLLEAGRGGGRRRRDGRRLHHDPGCRRARLFLMFDKLQRFRGEHAGFRRLRLALTKLADRIITIQHRFPPFII